MSAQVVRSSGNDFFDRSVENAEANLKKVTPELSGLINWKNPSETFGVNVFGSYQLRESTSVQSNPNYWNIVPVTEWIDAAEMSAAGVAVVQVDADAPASIKRFERLVAAGHDVPVIAAAYEPPLALVRSLLRMGAHDVLPLPLTIDDLETSIAPLAQQIEQKDVQALARTSRLVTVVRARGGCGATALVNRFCE